MAKKSFQGSTKSIDPKKDSILWFFLFLFAIAGGMVLWLLWPFLSVLVFSGIIASVFQPIYRKLSGWMRPHLASAATCTVIFMAVFVPLVFGVGALSQQALSLYQMGKNAIISDRVRTLLENSTLLERANHVLEPFHLQVTGEQVNQAASEAGKAVGLFLYQQAGTIAGNVMSFLFYFFFLLLIVFFFFVDGDRLIAYLMALSPLPTEQDSRLLTRFKDMAGAILIGNGLGGLIQGILAGVLFAVFDLKSSILWGFITMITSFVPIVGAGIVYIPTIVYLVLIDRVAVAITFAVFFIVSFGAVEYWLKPTLVGKRGNMHTLLVFLSLLGGVKLFGVLGIVYGPLVLTGFLTLTDIYLSHYQKWVED
ncbi:AI-2E family transporter [Desulfatirhabdium butyrativorans]|uniref:AI-2E family transporter n=1 Tax=Desulfatirhabdium butyrativorans TaxID=340467 RepID=UPI0004103AD2|nr:AI-2E family transporter [Desulfatirhabdium butyrativorans]